MEKSSKRYEERMRKTVAVAIEEGCRFFITSLGNPRWVVDMVKPAGGIVYHDVTLKKWAEKALENSGLSAGEIDMILVATMSPDYLSPSTSNLIQANSLLSIGNFLGMIYFHSFVLVLNTYVSLHEQFSPFVPS